MPNDGKLRPDQPLLSTPSVAFDIAMRKHQQEVLHEVKELFGALHRRIDRLNDCVETRLDSILEARPAMLQETHAPSHQVANPQSYQMPKLRQETPAAPSFDTANKQSCKTPPPDERPATDVDKEQAALKEFHEAKNWMDIFHRGNSADTEDEDMIFEECEEAEKKKIKLRDVVRSELFDLMAGLCVILNAILMIVEIEYKGMVAADVVGMSGGIEGSETADRIFQVSSDIFVVLFTVELVVRLWVYRRRYFKEWLNWLDFVVVTLSVVETFVFSWLLKVDVPDMIVLRLVRLMKLSRTLKIFRVLNLIYPLRVLVVSIISSLGALWWAIVLFTLLQIIASIVMTQLLNDFLASPDGDLKLKREVFHFFGRWTYSMLTMFQIVIAPGGWIKIGRILIFQVSPFYAVFFIPYVWGVTFAMVRIITAIFLKEAMSAAAMDDQISTQEHIRKRRHETKRLKQIFQEGDKDGDDTMSRKEFKKVLQNSHARNWLADLGLEVNEISGMFALLDNGDGKISYEEFISGVLRLRGGSKTLDLATILYENKKIHLKLDELREFFQSSETAGNPIAGPRMLPCV